MEFGITLEIDKDAYQKAPLIHNLSNEINAFLKNKNYGEGVIELVIGCICVYTKPGYEHFFKLRPPRYTEYRESKTRDGKPYTIERYFAFDIKFDYDEYDEFITVSDDKSRKMLINKIIDSLGSIDKIPKKVKNFDRSKFKEDFGNFLLQAIR